MRGKVWGKLICPGVAMMVLTVILSFSGCAGGKDVSSPSVMPPESVEGGVTGGVQESSGERYTVKGGLAPTGGVVEGENYKITPAGK